MKKTIAILLILLTILSFCNPISFAEDGSFYDESTESIDDFETTKEDEQGLLEGTVSTHGDEGDNPVPIQANGSAFDGITNLISKILSVFPALGRTILSLITYGNINDTFTIQKLLSNEYGLTDINFFKNLDNSVRYASTMNKLKNQVAIWYVSLRNVSAIALVIVLIYVAIRMAISTVADEKARYKKMFLFWIEAVALLFLLHYIIIIALYVSETINNLLIQAMSNVASSAGSTTSIEESLIKDITSNLDNAEGSVEIVTYLVLSIMLIYYEMKFLIMYFTRVIRVGFLMVIAPFVCITYPIDKIGDGRPQAFNSWIAEMLIEIFLQTIHLAIYIVFIFSAGAIIETSPVIGILFLATLGNAEKIVKSLLKIRPSFAKGVSDTKLPGQ